MYNFTQARDIIYKYVCDATDNLEYKNMAYKLQEVEVIALLLESELSVSDFKKCKEPLEVAQAYWVHPIHGFKDQLVDLNLQEYSLDLLDDMYQELNDIKVTREKEEAERKIKVIRRKEAIEKLSDEERRIYIGVIGSNISRTKSPTTERFNLMLELAETLPLVRVWLINNQRFMDTKREYWFLDCPYVLSRNKYPNCPDFVSDVLEPTLW